MLGFYQAEERKYKAHFIAHLTNTQAAKLAHKIAKQNGLTIRVKFNADDFSGYCEPEIDYHLIGLYRAPDFGTVLHELAHAIAAELFDDDTHGRKYQAIHRQLFERYTPKGVN